jgi:hypothetical protein
VTAPTDTQVPGKRHTGSACKKRPKTNKPPPRQEHEIHLGANPAQPNIASSITSKPDDTSKGSTLRKPSRQAILPQKKHRPNAAIPLLAHHASHTRETLTILLGTVQTATHNTYH